MVNKSKMCTRKVSFRTKRKAEAVALRYNQRVYECPICFCWHTTNRDNWKSEFIGAEEHRIAMASLEQKIRTELNAKLKEKRKRIYELEKELKLVTQH